MTRNCQIYIMPLDTLKIGIYKLKYFMNCIKVKRNSLLNSIYSSVFPDFRFKDTPYVKFYTDPELSSSLYVSSDIDVYIDANVFSFIIIIISILIILLVTTFYDNKKYEVMRLLLKHPNGGSVVEHSSCE